ncbi:glycosyltransferase [Flavihumibacter sediminis]|nr:glycosyltransferase [Flavihumibacter sediminis]
MKADILLVFRKVKPGFQSIERVFAEIIKAMPADVSIRKQEVPRQTRGIVDVLRNIIFIFSKTASVYHITGDIHYVAALLPSRRTILTIHDIGFVNQNSGLKRKLLKWLLLDMPVFKAGIVTAISDFTKRQVIEYTNCDPSKIIVIPNPLNEKIRYQIKEFNTVKPSILFLGTRTNKNLESSIKAIAGISCKLIIVGRLSDEQLALLHNYRIEFDNRFNLSDQELAECFVETDIVLFPSLFEGFGLPIIEGQKAGRIVITSELEPMKQVAGDGAILIDPTCISSIRQGVLMAINNEKNRKHLISRGFENIIQYEPGSIALQYLNLYQKLANKN